MREAARLQAAIELLDSIIAAAAGGGAAADTIIARYFKTRRYAGSGDRQAIRSLVYRAIRRFGERPSSGRAAMLGLVEEMPELLAGFDGSAHGPAPVQDGEERARPGLLPDWLRPRLDPLIDEAELRALIGRAPLDLRINPSRTRREDVLSRLPEAALTPWSPLGLRLPEGFRVEESDAWKSGLVEIQDEGSQLICLACDAKPGFLVVDLCAGAGGKTLGLAATMNGQGRIVASDTDRQRLARMGPRLERAGVSLAETRLLDPGREMEKLGDLVGQADLVLVDAPCSGSGTWRRNPEARWRSSPARLERLVRLQSTLLDIGSELVKPGGTLVYAVCSLLSEEGRAQAQSLGARSSLVPVPIAMEAGRTAAPGLLLTPGNDGTDGFFIARWRRP